VQADHRLARALVEAQVDERVLVGELGQAGEQGGAPRRVDRLDERLQGRGRKPVRAPFGRSA
jgi:hypothetical protein